MFATRRDQENVTHLHQQAASTKPLNQANLKTPGPKANAPKTPFRNRNDENAARTIAKGGKADQQNLFVTPLTTKPRAVLGAKTTNAKALATPGQALKNTLKQAPPSTQKISPRLRRSKVRVHQPTSAPTLEDGDDSAPEVEYCPPPSVRTPPLPDHPDDFHEWFAANKDLFDGKQATRYCAAIPPEEEDEQGWTASDRRMIADARASQAKAIRESQETWLENFPLSDPVAEAARLKAVAKAKAERERKDGPSTLKAQSAARALSGGASERAAIPSFAAPTKAARSRAEATGIGKENERFGAAKALSRTTVGYSKGRQVSATKRAPLSAAHRTPVVKMKEGGRPKVADVLLDGSESELEGEEQRAESVRKLDDMFNQMAMEDFVLEL